MQMDGCKQEDPHMVKFGLQIYESAGWKTLNQTCSLMIMIVDVIIIMAPTSATGNVRETLLINVQNKPKRILITTSSPVKP